ncbi:MAG: HD domain-containing phosphohydrolase [Eubacteriales bacterium]
MLKPKNSDTAIKGRFFLSKVSLAVASACLVALSIFLWANQESRNLSNLQEQLFSQTDSCAGDVEVRYNRIHEGIESLTKREIYPDTVNANEWVKDSTFFIGSFKGISKILMVDNNLNIKKIVPLSENKFFVDKNISNMALEEDEIDIWQPIYDNQKLKGFVVGVVDTAKLMEPILVNDKANYMVRLVEEGKVIFLSKNWIENSTPYTEDRTIVLQNSVSWQLTIAPTKVLFDSGFHSSRRLLIFSLALSFFVLLSLAFVQKYYANSKILAFKKKSEEKYRLITENTSDVIWVYNFKQNKFIFVSPAVFSLLGYTVNEATELTLEKIITPESMNTIRENMVRNSKKFSNDNKNENIYITEVQHICKNGDLVWVEISSKYRLNDEGEIEIVGVSRNIEDRKKTEKEILHLSYHDHLTGLYNRRFYEEELQRLDTKRNLPLSIIMGDVNGLKMINDSFGHEMGDELLNQVAEVLKKGCRADDIISRPGGDECVILLPKTDGKEVEHIINRIQAFLSEEKVCTLDVSVSFGYATKNDEEEDIQNTLKLSEELMYKNKLYESSSVRSKTIDVIINTLYEKSEREMLHSKRVSELCEAIALQMNFDINEVKQIKLAGYMHDIGKIGIDEAILNKPQKLSSPEWFEMHKHAEIGYRILSSANEFSEIADCILEHHERWDGSGYPKGLKGEDILIKARIVAIADAYDAMTSERTYKSTMSIEEAALEMKRGFGTQFDPEIVRVFIEKVLGEKW